MKSPRNSLIIGCLAGYRETRAVKLGGGRMNEPIFIVPKSWRWDDVLPGCQIAIVGDFLWLSGKTPRDYKQGDADGVVGRGDFEAQARQVFRNMHEVLDLVGCDFTSVIRLTTYFSTPIAEVAHKYRDVRREFFGDHCPATTEVQVAALESPDMLIEVDAVAYAPDAVIGPDARIVSVK